MVQLAAQSASPEAAQQALTDFCQTYWPPLYAFLRRRGNSPNDAQDLTQAFLVHLVEQNTLSRASADKGRLRTFLLGSLQHFLANEHDRAHRLKRGGGKQIVSIEEHLVEAEAAVMAGGVADATESYDQAWATTLVRRTWELLEEAYTAEGKREWLECMKPLVVGGTVTPRSPEQVAHELDVPISTIHTWIQRLRERYRKALHTEVARTVPNAADVEDELHYLFRLLMM